MPLYDKPLEELQVYLPERDEPDDFDAFWQTTLDQTRQHPLHPMFQRTPRFLPGSPDNVVHARLPARPVTTPRTRPP